MLKFYVIHRGRKTVTMLSVVQRTIAEIGGNTGCGGLSFTKMFDAINLLDYSNTLIRCHIEMWGR